MTKTVIPILLLALAALLTACKSKSEPKPQTSNADVSTAGSELQKRIKDNIKDKAARERLFFLIDETNRTMTKFNAAFLEHRDILGNNPGLPREAADNAMAEYAKVRIEFIRDIAKLRLEMRKYVNEAQWKAIFVDPEKEKAEAAVKEAEELSEGSAEETPVSVLETRRDMEVRS